MAYKAIDSGKLPEHKLWAFDLKYAEDNDEFTREFQRRNPLCSGVVPDRNKWLKIMPGEDRSIDGFNEEMIKPEEDAPVKVEEKDFSCPGCGKEFTGNHIGRRNHVKKCKEAMNKRT